MHLLDIMIVKSTFIFADISCPALRSSFGLVSEV
jgi:hypothetical protein